LSSCFPNCFGIEKLSLVYFRVGCLTSLTAGEVVALIAVAPHFKSAGRKSAIQNRQASVCGVVLSVSPRESHGTIRLFSIEPEISSLPTLVRFRGLRFHLGFIPSPPCLFVTRAYGQI